MENGAPENVGPNRTTGKTDRTERIAFSAPATARRIVASMHRRLLQRRAFVTPLRRRFMNAASRTTDGAV